MSLAKLAQRCSGSRQTVSRVVGPSRRRPIDRLLSGRTFHLVDLVSTSTDPFLNLSIEQFLLDHGGISPDGHVLFQYTNRPCVVIGRNQNPWVEVNLNRMRPSRPGAAPEEAPLAGGTDGGTGDYANVDLVRRRSGGGTVLHDEGNANWSVISPSASFSRETHARLVTSALVRLGIRSARVNSRHDIVIHQEGKAGPYKVSGSAYRLTRNRALHHGTCLLNSPAVTGGKIWQFLDSPAAQAQLGMQIIAKGSESVRSPVCNVGLPTKKFVAAVRKMFWSHYWSTVRGPGSGKSLAGVVGEEMLEIDEIRKGYEELKSDEWKFLQTPHFTLSIPAEKGSLGIELETRKGTIVNIRLFSSNELEQNFWESTSGLINEKIVSHKLHEISNWTLLLQQATSDIPGFTSDGPHLPLLMTTAERIGYALPSIS